MRTAHENNGTRQIRPFDYPDSPQAPSAPDWQCWAEIEDQGLAPDRGHDHAKTSKELAAHAEFEKRLAEETRKAFDAGREKGHQDGRQAERAAQAAARKADDERRIRQGAELVESFQKERDRYLRAVEHEVVRLALAVAARILRREAQMDPLLLTGAVRVALGQLSASTEVRLRVPSGELALWTEAVALLPNLALKPSVEAGEGMCLGDCVIETSCGSVDIGIRSQLAEIERGFFDRAGSGRSGPGPQPLAEIAASKVASGEAL
jgi:flagellar assembly protein FliH